MSRKSSPFAALSSREQQERWLEFQNTKLPYINGEMDTTLSEKDSDWLGRRDPRGQNRSVPTMNQGENPPRNPQAFQKTAHRQYDSVIRRMMDAEKQAAQYQSSPL